MKPTETPTTDTALIAIIARKPCGCVSGYDMDPVPEKRAELEAEGYTVTELPLTEARTLLGAAHDTCTHGSTRTQLAAKVKELQAVIARAPEKGITGTCGVLVDPDGSLPRLVIYTTREHMEAFGSDPNGQPVEVRLAKPKASPVPT